MLLAKYLYPARPIRSSNLVSSDDSGASHSTGRTPNNTEQPSNTEQSQTTDCKPCIKIIIMYASPTCRNSRGRLRIGDLHGTASQSDMVPQKITLDSKSYTLNAKPCFLKATSYADSQRGVHEKSLGVRIMGLGFSVWV